MKKVEITLIILVIALLLSFFIFFINKNEFLLTIEEESEIVTKDIERKIRFEFGNKEILVLLENNNSSRAFYDRLPLEFEFKDYARTEKVTDLPEPLPKREGNFGYDPKLGDFAYYAPWEGLVLYYNDFQYSTGIIKLGVVIEGLENLRDLEGIVSVSKVN